MAHFSKVCNGVVVKVIVAEPEFFNTFIDDSPGEWIKTSYNIVGGVYYDPVTGLPAEDQSVILQDKARQRKNYGGIGYTYDANLDAFIPPKPRLLDSWVLNENTCLWEAPVSPPEDNNTEDSDGNIIYYTWDEDAYQTDPTTGWVKVVSSP